MDNDNGSLGKASLSASLVSVVLADVPVIVDIAATSCSRAAEPSPAEATAIAEIKKLGGRVVVDEKEPRPASHCGGLYANHRR